MKNSAQEVAAEFLAKNAFLRLPQVLALVPVSRSTWWGRVRTGDFPAPVKLGPRMTAWRASDIAALLDRLTANAEG